MKIPLSAPEIADTDIAAVVSVMRSGRLSLGPAADTFEADFCAYLNIPFAVAVSSGTAGLHLALLALGIGPMDEVIVPSFTFIAAANAIRYVGAKPVFVDIDPVTLNMNPEMVAAAITARTRALMVVHTFGVPAAMDSLLGLVRHYGLKLIEDACEALGAEYKGQRVGTFGDAGIFAFYANKQMTTGEGGMVVMRSSAVAEMTRSLRNQGRASGEWLEHERLGYNYRLSELHAAFGVSQLRRIESFLAMRAAAADQYAKALGGSDDYTLPLAAMPDRRVSWFVYVLRLTAKFSQYQRDLIIEKMAEEEIACGRYFAPVHRQNAYKGFTGADVSLPVTEFVSQRTIALPFFNRLSPEMVSQVADCLLRAIADV